MLTVNLVEKNLLQFMRVERFTDLSIKRVLAHLGDMDQDAKVGFTLKGFNMGRNDPSMVELRLGYEASTVAEVFETLDNFVNVTDTMYANGFTSQITEETTLSLGLDFPLNLMTFAILMEEGIDAAFDYNKQTVRS